MTDDVINVHRHWVRTKVTNACGNDGERTQGEASRVLTGSVDPDESGLDWLTLTHADGATERYHRWNQPE